MHWRSHRKPLKIKQVHVFRSTLTGFTGGNKSERGPITSRGEEHWPRECNNITHPPFQKRALGDIRFSKPPRFQEPTPQQPATSSQEPATSSQPASPMEQIFNSHLRARPKQATGFPLMDISLPSDPKQGFHGLQGLGSDGRPQEVHGRLRCPLSP